MKTIYLLTAGLCGLILLGCSEPVPPTQAGGIEPVSLDSRTFASEVEEGKGLALVDFWAEWCEPCKVVSKHVETLADRYDGQLLVAKVDVDIASDVAKRHEVKSLPSVFFYRDGEKVGEIIGLTTLEALEAEVSRLLSE